MLTINRARQNILYLRKFDNWQERSDRGKYASTYHRLPRSLADVSAHSGSRRKADQDEKRYIRRPRESAQCEAGLQFQYESDRGAYSSR